MPYVYTVNGERRDYAYAYDSRGEILKFRTDTGDIVRRFGNVGPSNFGEPHPQWRITGAFERRPFGRVKFWTLPDFLDYVGANSKHLKFKNGSSRFHLADVDHGTRRMHGDTVRAISFLSD